MLPGLRMQRTNQRQLGLTMGSITPAPLGEAPRRAEDLPAGGEITGPPKARCIHEGFGEQDGMPIVAFPVPAEPFHVEG